jgi:hypothetical protein
MAAAAAGVSGYLSAADWATFNGKQAALGFTPLNADGGSLGGVLDMSSHVIANLAAPSSANDAARKADVDALANLTVDVAHGGTGQTTAAAALTALLPAQASESGKYLQTNGTSASWASAPSGSSLAASDGTPAQAVYVDAVGNVGVGTTSPTSKLQVAGGDIAVDDAKGLTSPGGLVLSAVGVNVHGSATAGDLFGTDGNDLRIGGDGTGSGGKGLYLRGYDSAGSTWRDGLQYINRAGIPYLALQPGGGNVGIGTTSPSYKLHISGGTLAVDSGSGLDTIRLSDAVITKQPGDALVVYSNVQAPGSWFQGSSLWLGDGSSTANVYTTDTSIPMVFHIAWDEAMRIDTDKRVGIGTSTPGYLLEVNGDASVDDGLTAKRASGTPLTVNRTVDDGTLVALQQDGVDEGSISVSAGIVSFNPFTGSHYGWTADTDLEVGTLVTMTGDNRRLNESPGSELIYGVARAQRYNDPAILGAYLGPQGSTTVQGTPISLVMAVGNGEMWVMDSGAPLAVGDYLISSAVPGHAMKDDARAPISHVVARVAEPVDWRDAETLADGRRHKRVSVLFDNFSKDNATRAELDALKSAFCELSPAAKICAAP